MDAASRLAWMVAASVSVMLCWSVGAADTKQDHVHQMSHDVMPFDMAKTLHVFKMTESGGIERVIVRDSKDHDQIGLIRQHLKHEAENFAAGNYSDPSRLHGASMPGLKELQAGAQRIEVSYREISNGAEIEFQTKDISLLTALHRWFGAQLSEHGPDARAE